MLWPAPTRIQQAPQTGGAGGAVEGIEHIGSASARWHTSCPRIQCSNALIVFALMMNQLRKFTIAEPGPDGFCRDDGIELWARNSEVSDTVAPRAQRAGRSSAAAGPAAHPAATLDLFDIRGQLNHAEHQRLGGSIGRLTHLRNIASASCSISSASMAPP